MAYPTNLKWRPQTPVVGMQPLDATSSVQRHPLGTIVRAEEVGAGYGAGEFIYLKGASSTVKGDLVVYDQLNSTTTRAVEASRGPCAVALSDNGAAGYGWYQISGTAIVATAASAAAGGQAYVSSTDGTLGVTPGQTAGDKVERATFLTATNTPSAGFTAVQLSRPSADGAGLGP